MSDIERFLGKWRGLGSVPLVAIPTLYPTFSAAQLHSKGFSMVILANQPMRAAVHAIEQTLRRMREHGGAAPVEPSIATVDHVLDLVGFRDAISAEDGSARM